MRATRSQSNGDDKKLPPASVLQQFVDEGLSTMEIAERYGVSDQWVRKMLDNYGIERVLLRPNHRDLFAVRPKEFQRRHPLCKYAMMWNASQQPVKGKEIPPKEQQKLNEWLEFMDGRNSRRVPLAVHFDGREFWLEPRREGETYVSKAL